MALNLYWRGLAAANLDGSGLRPDALAGLSPDDVRRVRIPRGRETVELGELFAIDGDLADGHLVLDRGTPPIRGVGAGMASGRLTIAGDAGPRLGLGMTGGQIEVGGSVAVWAGAEMRGGTIRVRGSAGDSLGSALPGSRVGMRGGSILVDGDIGDGAGLAMRRGLIAVAGRAGDDLGHGLVAGTIVAFGPVGRRPGAAMKRGSLLLLGETTAGLPPGFRFAAIQSPPYATICLRGLAERGFPAAGAGVPRSYRRYNGDVVEGGQGEILVPMPGPDRVAP